MKRVLFDENMPRKLRRDLLGCVVRTVQEEGWDGLENGDLCEIIARIKPGEVIQVKV